RIKYHSIFTQQPTLQPLLHQFATTIPDFALLNARIKRRNQTLRRDAQFLMCVRTAQQFQQLGSYHTWAAFRAASYTCFSGTAARSATCRHDSNSGAICTALPSSRPIFTA